MTMTVNVRYCPTCGGVTQWEEYNPAAGATMGNRVVKASEIVTPSPTVTVSHTTTGMRFCSCLRNSGQPYAI